MKGRSELFARNELYVRACMRLSSIGRRTRIGTRGAGRKRSGRAFHGKWLSSAAATREASLELRRQLHLSKMELDPDSVLLAARTAGFLFAIGVAIVSFAMFLLSSYSLGILMALLCPIAYWASCEAIAGYPRSAAKHRASMIMRESASASNLMIMSLRQNPSLPKAIRFASGHADEFSEELRQSLWDVIMGSHSSFEESLLSLGERWYLQAPELKSSLTSMITAASESSEEGRRRALDRANSTLVQGAKRRIEEYALSLSTPSMILFGLGILLPIMVGSFLPILSWDLWSMDASREDVNASGSSGELLQTAFFMNVLFPAIAFLIAANAISGHPLVGVKRLPGLELKPAARGLVLALTGMFLALTLTIVALNDIYRYIGVLFSAAVPLAIWLMAAGGGWGPPLKGRETQAEDDLFKVGSRMLEGENLESATAAVSREGSQQGILRRLIFRTCLMGQDMSDAAKAEGSFGGDANVAGAIRIVHESAYKDEPAAGMLAMDLATYLRDLRSLDSALRSRLKPTVSMMKTTANVLGPVVLGITYMMYLTLSTMVPGGSGMQDAGVFFLILGAFLAETNAIVVYFVWGIEGREGWSALARSVGTCILLSELVFAATAVLAS